MSILTKIKQKKFLLPIVLATIALFVGVGLFVTKQDDEPTQGKPLTAEQKTEAIGDIHSYAETLKPKQTLKDLKTAEEKQTFLKSEASKIGLLKPGIEPSPKALVTSCIERRTRELSALQARYAEHMDEIEEGFKQTVRQSLQYCYQTYAVDGKMPAEDMPNEMHH